MQVTNAVHELLSRSLCLPKDRLCEHTDAFTQVKYNDYLLATRLLDVPCQSVRNVALAVSPDSEGIGFAPSVLNGGLNNIPLAYWITVIALTGALETQFLKATPELIAQGKEPGEC